MLQRWFVSLLLGLRVHLQLTNIGREILQFDTVPSANLVLLCVLLLAAVREQKQIFAWTFVLAVFPTPRLNPSLVATPFALQLWQFMWTTIKLAPRVMAL